MKMNYDLYANDKSVALLAILDILRRFGDTYNKREMQDELEKGYGITVTRNTFTAKLKTLDRCGYTLRESEDGNHYIFEGREFTDAQLRVLIDCLIYNGVVGSETAKKMIAELCDLGSETLRNSCRKFQNCVRGRKHSSDIVTENLEIIQRAIAGEAKIICNYKVYNKRLELDYKYKSNITVSPFDITLSNGRYILICALDGEDSFTHFYVDKLCDIRLKKEPVRKAGKILSLLGYRDMNEYINSQPVLCGGSKDRFTLKIDNDIVDDFLNDFGGDFRKEPFHVEIDGYSTVITVTTSADSLRRLIMPYIDKIVVLDKPAFYDELKEQFETGMHNQRMIGKNRMIKSRSARTLEESIRICEINDLNFIHFCPRTRDKKVDLSKLDGYDWIEGVDLRDSDITGQRFPETLTSLRRVSLIRCKYDMEAITENENITELRFSELSADDLERLSCKTNITRFNLYAHTYLDRTKNEETVKDVKDLGFLENWNELRNLDIYGYTEIEDISALRGKNELRILDLDKCTKIKDISPVKELKNLRRLSMRGCSVTEEQIEEISRALPECSVITDDHWYKGGEKTKSGRF